MIRVKKIFKKFIQRKPDPLTVEAIGLFNQHKFREALLKFEEPWKNTYGQEERFLRGLIQVSGAFHHFDENRLESALSLYASSLELLSNYLPIYQRIDVEKLMEDMKIAYEEIHNKGAKSEVKLDTKLVPKIWII